MAKQKINKTLIRTFKGLKNLKQNKKNEQIYKKNQLKI